MAVELDVGQPILLAPGEGEVIGDAEDRRVEILCDRDELCAHGHGSGQDVTARIPTSTDITPTSSTCSTAS